MSERRAIHERVLHAKSVDELTDAYRAWADGYDRDMLEEMGYRVHIEVANTIGNVLKPGRSRLLDAGCGTGLVGVELGRLGFSEIVGLDVSPDMLAQASAKGVYTRLCQADLMAPLEFPSGYFDAVTCVATFTLGHVGPSALVELMRVTRPGGYLCFTVREEAWERLNFADLLGSGVNAGELIEVAIRTRPYIEEDNSMCRLCLYQLPPEQT